MCVWVCLYWVALEIGVAWRGVAWRGVVNVTCQEQETDLGRPKSADSSLSHLERARRRTRDRESKRVGGETKTKRRGKKGRERELTEKGRERERERKRKKKERARKRVCGPGLFRLAGFWPRSASQQATDVQNMLCSSASTQCAERVRESEGGREGGGRSGVRI